MNDLSGSPSLIITCTFLVFIALFTGSGVASYAQTNEDSVKIQFSAWGSFRGHIAYFDKDLKIQENASRMGLELSVFHKEIRFFGGAELAINLFRSPQIFNADANTNSGFLSLEDIQNQQVFVPAWDTWVRNLVNLVWSRCSIFGRG